MKALPLSMKKLTPFLSLLVCATLLPAKQDTRSCASHPGKWREELHLHQRSRVARSKVRTASVEKAAVLTDVGNLALLDETDGVVARRNPFNLNGKTIRFLPAGAGSYKYDLAGDPYDDAAAQQGTLLNLDDDDTQDVEIPFAFPFFGDAKRTLHLNSDGNVTFGAGDTETSDRSLGRFLSGPGRIAALFTDLDPTQARVGVKLQNEPNRLVISWVEVPPYQDSGTGPLQTFQIRLHSDGKIEIAYRTVQIGDAVVGVTPGGLPNEPKLVSFANDINDMAIEGAIAERFSASSSVDIFAAAQKFYRNHEDAYDYLVIYNAMGIPAQESAVAYEVTVRNNRRGFGDLIYDAGAQAGSPRRLQAIMNMGPLNQYPRDTSGKVAGRMSVGDTPLSILAHEAGHLFLAYASTMDGTGNTPMIGFQGAHWDFKFNSDASILEGNRIEDKGPGASPRFLTTATVEGFSALDQYLMGLRAPSEVPDTFYVSNARGANINGLPRVGVAFDGERKNVSLQEIVQMEGRRSPDHTVAQREFRFAFVVVTANGETPTPDQIAQAEAYRSEFEAYFYKVTGQRATADTSLRKAVQVSTSPASGVVLGAKTRATVSLQEPAASPVTFGIRGTLGAAKAPESITVPVGAREATFEIEGIFEGVDTLTVESTDAAYEKVVSRIQVRPLSQLQLRRVSESIPARIKVTDANELPYPGIEVRGRLASGTPLSRSTVTSDANGTALFAWTPVFGREESLSVEVDGGPSLSVGPAGRPDFAASSVLNAASFSPGMVSGGIATIFGKRLGGSDARVVVDGRSVPVFFGNDEQLNFLLLPSYLGSQAQVSVETASGSSLPVRVPVRFVQPGVFYDTGTRVGAVIQNGQFLEIYATGLGMARYGNSGLVETLAVPQVQIGGTAAEVLFSGLAPGFVGLYQINVRLPSGVSTGQQPLVIRSGSVTSNEVLVQIR